MSGPVCSDPYIAGVPPGSGLFPNAALQALLVQIASLPLTLTVVFFLAWAHIAVLSWSTILLLHGTLAAVVAACIRAPVWWLVIHFMFPVAVVVVYRWNLPPTVFFAGFALSLGLFWTIFRTRVPFYPSGRGVWEAVLATLPNGPVKVIDVGSGIGGLAMHLARQRDDVKVCGIEAAPFPYLFSMLRNMDRTRNCVFRWGRYESIDLGGFDVVFAYLSPVAMPALWEKAQAEMRSGTIFYSYEFEVPGRAPQQIISIPGRKEVLYRWTM